MFVGFKGAKGTGTGLKIVKPNSGNFVAFSGKMVLVCVDTSMIGTVLTMEKVILLETISTIYSSID